MTAVFGVMLVLCPNPNPDPTATKRTGPETTMLNATRSFLAGLNPEQKGRAVFPFNAEERLNWHFIPKERKGIPYKEMTSAQQDAAVNLLKIGLSQKGFEKVSTIRQLENVLKVIEAGKGPVRDPELYYFTVFGEPSENGSWGWRYEGHHVSLNWTIIKGRVIASTPQFLGSNPGEVMDGPMKGTRVLKAEEDLGRSLVKSLSEEQRKEGIISDKAPTDILTSNQRVAAIQEDKGIGYKKLTREQQGILIALIEEHASAQRAEISRKRLDSARKSGLDSVKFAWMGGLDRGQGHYYRIQGRTFLIEYDNTQNNANHIHTVWREFKGDWGTDLLAEHYAHFKHDGSAHHH